jgi:isocitrate lyase
MRPEGVFAFGISHAADAIIAEMAGFDELYVGGYAAAAIRGLPDMGIIGQQEMLQHIQYICEAAPNRLVIADADDGYGSVHNVRRTVSDLCEKTYVAGFHMEDQRYPKRCGHIDGKDVLPLDEYMEKLEAAIDMKNDIDPTRIIVARTDAFSAASGTKDPEVGGDIHEAVRRGIAYAELGADLVWCEFPTPSRSSARAFAAGMQERMPKLGLAFNVSPSFRWDLETQPLTIKELSAMGYSYLFSTYPSLTASMHAVYQAAQEFKKYGIEGLAALQRRVAESPAISAMKVLGVPRYLDIERRYSARWTGLLNASKGIKK